ncbi:MAG: radical SAM protein [archaeon]
MVQFIGELGLSGTERIEDEAGAKELLEKYYGELEIGTESPGREAVKTMALLQWGATAAPEEARKIADWTDPTRTVRTGNVGVQGLLRKGDLTTSASFAMAEWGPVDTPAGYSPLRIIKGELEGEFLPLGIIGPDGKGLGEFLARRARSWYEKKLPSGGLLTAAFLEEGAFSEDGLSGNLMAGLPYACSVQAQGGCVFCPFGKGETGIPTAEDFGFAAVEAVGRNGGRTTITITAGNTGRPERGLERYLPVLSEIRERLIEAGLKPPPIQLEVSPPNWEVLGYLGVEELFGKLIELGVTSLMLNPEIPITPENAREREVRLKSKGSIPESDYLRSWELAKKMDLGTAGVLIWGLGGEAADYRDFSALEAYKSGVDKMASVGAYPVSLALRPRGALMGKYAPPPLKGQVELVIYSANVCAKAGISPPPGCSKCSACGPDGVAYDLALKGELK